jgi:hypothetical protein
MTSPIVIGLAILDPRIVFWKNHGWRCEIIIRDDARGDAVFSDFYPTRDEAERWSERAMLKAAERYAEAL